MRRIAVLRANGIGDFVFSLPALEALRAAYPAADIALLGQPWHRGFLEGRPSPVDRCIVVPPSRGVRSPPEGPEDAAELERFFEEMRAERFDLALQLHGGGRWSNPFVQRLGAPLTAGSRAEDAAPLDRWIRYVYHQPEILRYLEIVGLVGASPVTVQPRVHLTDADRAEAGALVTRGPLAVLAPCASDPRRHWPAERFGEVGDGLAAEGLAVALVGAGPDRRAVDAVRAAMRAEAVDLCDALTLGGLAALLARAAVVVANDSGPLHLADAVGARTVGVFWCGNLLNGGPAGRLRHRPLASFRVRCPVCGVDCTTGACAHDASFVADVPVADVLRGARDLLAERHAPPPPSLRRRPAGEIVGSSPPAAALPPSG